MDANKIYFMIIYLRIKINISIPESFNTFNISLLLKNNFFEFTSHTSKLKKFILKFKKKMFKTLVLNISDIQT